MGHDILGFNKARGEIAFARFGKDNYNATILYSLLDSKDYYAGVSGSGDHSIFSIQQIERAIEAYYQLYDNDDLQSESTFINWDKEQISNFLLNCLATAKKEGSVVVYFG